MSQFVFSAHHNFLKQNMMRSISGQASPLSELPIHPALSHLSFHSQLAPQVLDSGQLISLFYEESLRRASFKKFCHQIAPTIKRAGCNFVHQPRKIQILGGISVSDIAVN